MDKFKKVKLQKYPKKQNVVYSLIWESTSFKRALTGKNEILLRDLKYRNHNLIFVTRKLEEIKSLKVSSDQGIDHLYMH